MKDASPAAMRFWLYSLGGFVLGGGRAGEEESWSIDTVIEDDDGWLAGCNIDASPGGNDR